MSQREQDPSQKTEDPTQRKLDDALEKGNVAKSQEINNLFMLVTGLLVVGTFLPFMASSLRHLLVGFLAEPHSIPFNHLQLLLIMREVAVEVLKILALPILFIAVSGVTANMIQHPPIFSIEKLKPSLSKHNPITNLRKKFSLRQLVQFAMTLAKMSIVFSVLAMLMVPQLSTITQLMTVDLSEIPNIILRLVMMVVGGVTIAMLFIAGIDFWYQKWEHSKSQRMSRQEVKDEHKESDGSPEVKQRLRKICQDRGRARMIAQVPEATVVVTNPTHFAVALKYEHEVMDAPIVVAKGTDEFALRIREVASEHRVPIVENQPLAQALFATAEVDREIPVEHFKAVAEVIGYVMKLKRQKITRRQRGP